MTPPIPSDPDDSDDSVDSPPFQSFTALSLSHSLRRPSLHLSLLISSIRVKEEHGESKPLPQDQDLPGMDQFYYLRTEEKKPGKFFPIPYLQPKIDGKMKKFPQSPLQIIRKAASGG